MIINLLTWVLYGIVIFLTFRGCEWAWRRICKKRDYREVTKGLPTQQIEVIHKQALPQMVQVGQPQPQQPEKAEKNVIVNNYSFGGGL